MGVEVFSPFFENLPRCDHSFSLCAKDMLFPCWLSLEFLTIVFEGTDDYK